MKPKLSHLLLGAACLTLAACATATPYQPAMNHASGYSDQRIENNRFRVTFAGNSLTSVERVENYLLYRAAELTLQQGYDYFVIANRETASKERLVGGPIGPVGPAYPGYYGAWGIGWRYYSPGIGWGFGYDPFFNNDIEMRKITKYQATAEISMGKGAKPADNPHAYDARQVIQNLGHTIERPQ